MKTRKNIISKIFNAKNLLWFIFFSFLVSIGYVIVRIVLAPTIMPTLDAVDRVKSDYVLMLLQCVIGLFAMILPRFIMRKNRWSIPTVMMSLYALFLYCAIYLGEVRNFYYNVPHWDTVLHTFSGAGLGALGFSLVSLLNKSETLHLGLSPAFVAMFAFCFAVSLGVIWEIYEFTADGILQTNMQKYSLENNDMLIGRGALADTMKDLVVDVIGAFAMSIIGFISLKYEKGWLERIQLKSQ